MLTSFDKELKYLLFVGSGRTGSTLFGQLLNNHPEILVSNESRILQHCVTNKICISKNLSNLFRISFNEFQNGTLKYDQKVDAENTNKWQRDWKKIDNSLKIKKTEIKYIGDKKQGGNTELLLKDSDNIKYIDIDFIPITVIRNPIDVFSSYLRVNNNREISASTTIKNMIHGIDFTLKNKGVVINYDELIKNTEDYCKIVCNKLNISESKAWVNLVKKTISQKKPFDYDQKSINFFKNTDGYERLMRLYNENK